MSSPAAGPSLHQLTTPRAAALAGVLSALLFAAVLILIRVKMPEGLGDSTQWLNSQRGDILTATKLMPFAGITFLWFIGVVRDSFGRHESRLRIPLRARVLLTEVDLVKLHSSVRVSRVVNHSTVIELGL